jgi:acetylglutamate kinase
MIPKIESAIDAINSGVKQVHIIDGTSPHSILKVFIDDSEIGTTILKQ